MVIRANERSELALSDEFLVLHQRSAASRRRLFTDLLADGRSVATDTSDLGHSTVHHLFQLATKARDQLRDDIDWLPKALDRTQAKGKVLRGGGRHDRPLAIYS